MTPRQRLGAFAVVCVVAAAISIGYFALAQRPGQRTDAPPQHPVAPLARLDDTRRGVIFRSTIPDSTFGKVAFVPADALDGPWQVTTLECERVYFAGGRGVCLTLEYTQTPPFAISFFDRDFRSSAKHVLSGVPSRARVSADGRRASSTVFETGHSYAQGGFSTRTLIWDPETGKTTGDLEAFLIRRDGHPFKAPDFNLWGVTFVGDTPRVYASLQTAGKIFLVEGDVDRKEAHVVREGVECPSLSPDATRIAFKKRIIGRPDVLWQVAILDLATKQERVLEIESRSVDDQVEWLDDQHLLYHLPASEGTDIWMLNVNGQEEPRLLIRGGYSPASVR